MAEGSEATPISPTNIFDLIPEPVVRHMLTGFSYQLQARVVILYPPKQSSTSQDELLQVHAPEKLCHMVCRTYRDTPGCN